MGHGAGLGWAMGAGMGNAVQHDLDQSLDVVWLPLAANLLEPDLTPLDKSRYMAVLASR